MPDRINLRPYPILIRFGGWGGTDLISYYPVDNSDIAINPADYAFNGQLYVRFRYHLYQYAAGKTAYIEVYRQNSPTHDVSGSEKTTAGVGWAILKTDWIDWSAESGDESYMIALKADSGGYAYYNFAVMELCHYQY